MNTILDDVSSRKHNIPVPAGESVVKRRRLSDQSSLVLEYRNSVCLKYETVPEHGSASGGEVLLADRYSQLLIIQKHRDQREREEEMRSKGPVFQQVLQARAGERYRRTSVEQLFSSDDSGGAPPSTVILQGHSGHGKSFTVQKIMFDWAAGHLFQEYLLVLHVSCKELSSEEERSAVDLLSLTEEFSPLVSQTLLQSPEKVLLLIDGFDELGPPPEGAKVPAPADLFSQAPVKDLIRALLTRSLLPDCSLLVTTRSTVSDRLSRLLKQPQRFTEILGFSEDGVRDYFCRFFVDKQMAEKVHLSVRSNEMLYNACFIPLICWIVCTVLREKLKAGADIAKRLETTTSIFVSFVSNLLEHHWQGPSQEPLATLRALGQLAERGILDQRVLFDERSVHAAVPDPSRVPLLCKVLMPVRARLQSQYGFIHLSFQEFFYALLHVLRFHKEPEKLSEMLATRGDDEGNFVQPHLQPVVQFLFGLSNANVRSSLTGSVGSAAALMRPQLEKWMRRVFSKRKQFCSSSVLFILHCLYELHEEPLVREVMEAWGEVDIGFVPLSRTDCWVLLYCLQCCPSARSLRLRSCNLTPDNMRMLLPALQSCEELGLDTEELSDGDVGDLITALGEGKALSKLGVFNSSLSDESVQELCSALSRQKNVGPVQLSVKTISASTAATLLDSLARSHIESLTVDVTKESEGDEKSLCFCLSAKNYTKRLQLHRIEDSEEDGPEQTGEPSLLDTERVTLSHHRRFSKELNAKNLESHELPTQPAVSEISVSLTRSPDAHSSRWTQFLLHFHSLRALTEGDPWPDEQMEGLMSSLHSMSGLAEVELVVSCVTVSLTAKIISLIQACSTLQEVRVKAGWHFGPGIIADGLLLEEGLQLLKETHPRPDCRLILQGRRCTKPFEKCRHSEDRRLSCNREMEVVVYGEMMEEHSSDWGSLSDGDWGAEEEEEEEEEQSDEEQEKDRSKPGDMDSSGAETLNT